MNRNEFAVFTAEVLIPVTAFTIAVVTLVWITLATIDLTRRADLIEKQTGEQNV